MSPSLFLKAEERYEFPHIYHIVYYIMQTQTQPKTYMTDSNSPSEITILNAITSVLSRYIAESDPFVLFNGLLEQLLELTDSEYGFIGEVFRSQEGKPYIKNYATTNIAWDAETQKLFEASKQKGMIFNKLDSLYGTILKTGQTTISNTPGSDPRSGGLPPGHPPLNTFLGIPFYSEQELLGVVGLANRPSGYQAELVKTLQPFLITCGNLIRAYRNNQKHQQVAFELEQYRAKLNQVSDIVKLNQDYEFNCTQPTLTKNNQIIPLTKKELLLLAYLVNHRHRIVTHRELESHVWKSVVVSESSLRSLVKRLRQKMPEVAIKTHSGVGYILE